MLAFGTIDASVKRIVGKKGVTKQQTAVYCLPDDAAWEKVQTTRAQLQLAIDAFAAVLRQLGSYAKRLEESGGIKAAPNPLSPTVIMADDPDDDDHHYFVLDPIVRIERETVTSHTPKMLHIERDGKPWSTTHQRNHFVCPSNDAWDLLLARQRIAQDAHKAWQQLLKELGTYQAALADGRYARKEKAVSTPHTTTVHRQDWHALPPALSGWRWQQNKATNEMRLIGPDGWETKEYTYSNKAIAEALRRVHSQPKAALAVAEPVHVGVPMMDANEARAIVTSIKTRIDLARGELLELHDREGWRALGYKSWQACAQAEFGGSAAQMFRLLSAAQIERAIDSPIGEYPESHLREVAKLDTPAQQRQALSQAAARTNGQPTAKDVRAEAEAILGKTPADLVAAGVELTKHGAWFKASGDEWKSAAMPFEDAVIAAREEIARRTQAAAKPTRPEVAPAAMADDGPKTDAGRVADIRRYLDQQRRRGQIYDKATYNAAWELASAIYDGDTWRTITKEIGEMTNNGHGIPKAAPAPAALETPPDPIAGGQAFVTQQRAIMAQWSSSAMVSQKVHRQALDHIEALLALLAEHGPVPTLADLESEVAV
jgi:hypothetical protein